MANRKISDLTALTAPATGDLLPIVDISEAAAADKNKKITIGELFASIPLGTAAAPSVAFEGDPNTGIYSPGADQVAVATNGTEKLIVKSDGKVGLGTSSPAQALHVVSSTTYQGIFVNGNVAPNVSFNTNSSTTPNWKVGLSGTNSDNFSISAGAANDDKLIVDSSGRVGIGTASPSSLLHLADAGNITVGTSTGTKIGTATTQKIGFYNATPVVQPAAVANATTAVDVITQLNDLLAKLRTLGIIAT